MILLILLTLVAGANTRMTSGPCAVHLLATGDRIQDTKQFIMYVELLIEKRIVSLGDLEPFLKSIKDGRLTNPIPNTMSNKFFVFWHKEFQKLVDSNSVDLGQIRAWSEEYIKNKQVAKSEKEVVEEKTKVLPVYVAPDGAMFYQINHEKLGESYRILKPGGNYENERDWDEIIWPVNALKGSSGKLHVYTNSGGIDPTNNTLVSKKSRARKACIDKGKGVDLPTLQNYVDLLNHFENQLDQFNESELTERGLNDFHTLFPDSTHHYLWISTIWSHDSNSAYFFESIGGSVNSTNYRKIKYSVRCVGK